MSGDTRQSARRSPSSCAGLLSAPSALLKVRVRKRKLQQRLGVRRNVQKLQRRTHFLLRYVHSLAILGRVYLPDTWASPAQVTVGTRDPSCNGLVMFSKNAIGTAIAVSMHPNTDTPAVIIILCGFGAAGSHVLR